MAVTETYPLETLAVSVTNPLISPWTPSTTSKTTPLKDLNFTFSKKVTPEESKPVPPQEISSPFIPWTAAN